VIAPNRQSLRALLLDQVGLRPWAACLMVGLGAFVWAAVLSSDTWVMKLNWDTANYVSKYARGAAGWSDDPWNSHFALGAVYWLAHAVLSPLSGSYIFAVRALNALCFGLAGGLSAALFMRASGSRAFGCLIGCLYVSSWGLTLLLLHIEDNIVYLPFAVAVLAVAVHGLSGWRPVHSVAAGFTAGCGALISWQAGLYLLPALVAACVHLQARALTRRLRDVGLVVGAFTGAVLLWLGLYALTSTHSFADLITVVTSRPEPSYFPETWHDFMLLVRGPVRVFRHLGLGLVHEVGPLATESRAWRRALPVLGLVWLIAMGVLAIGATVWAKARRLRVLPFALGLCFAISALTSLYVDLPSDAFKRYEFVPLLLGLCVAAFARAIGQTSGEIFPHMLGSSKRRFGWLLSGLVAVCFVLFVVQLGAGLYWAKAYRAGLPDRHPPGYFGVGEQPWFVYLQHVRYQNPDRCRLVFALAELAHGRYQLEIPAALWDLPKERSRVRSRRSVADEGFVALGNPHEVELWRHPIRVRPPELFRRQACDWLSEPARALVQP